MKAFLGILLLLASSHTLKAEALTIKPVANDGVQIELGGKRLLIDALFTREYPQFDVPSEAQIQAFMGANGPEMVPDILLVTHDHGDHFSARLSIDLLMKQPKSRLFGPEQVIARIQSEATNEEFSKIKEQLTQTTPVQNAPDEFDIEGLSIKVYAFPHVSEQYANIQNNAYLISSGDESVLHIGDADVLEDSFKQKGLALKSLEYAVLPFWHILDEQKFGLLKSWFAEKQMILAHVHTAHQAQIKDMLSTNHPEMQLFIKP